MTQQTIDRIEDAGHDQEVPMQARSRRAPRWVWAVMLLALLGGALVVGRSTSSGTDSSPTVTTVDETGRLMAVVLELHDSGDLAAAQRAYEQVLVLAPDNSFALYDLGLIAQTRGQNTDAISFYDRSLALDPSLVSAQYNRGLARRDSGDADGAISDLRAVVAADPSHAPALYNLGNLIIAGGDVPGGTALVDQATRIDPTLRGDAG